MEAFLIAGLLFLTAGPLHTSSSFLKEEFNRPFQLGQNYQVPIQPGPVVVQAAAPPPPPAPASNCLTSGDVSNAGAIQNYLLGSCRGFLTKDMKEISICMSNDGVATKTACQDATKKSYFEAVCTEPKSVFQEKECCLVKQDSQNDATKGALYARKKIANDCIAQQRAKNNAAAGNAADPQGS